MAEQLSVFLQNESGKIASVASLLAAGGIDIRALSIADTKDFGVLRMLVSDARRAQTLLREAHTVAPRIKLRAVSIKPCPRISAAIRMTNRIIGVTRARLPIRRRV